MSASLTADPLWELQIHVFYNGLVHMYVLRVRALWELQIHMFYNGFVHMYVLRVRG